MVELSLEARIKQKQQLDTLDEQTSRDPTLS